jgi:serine phosphatase RsbU (regulator of sigma subunit)/HAMP domain-containing protein
MSNILHRFPFFQGLRVYYTPDKKFTSVSGRSLRWEPPEALIRDGFRQAIRGTTYISPVHYTPAGDALVLMMAPIAPPGESPRGVIAGIVGLDSAQEIADRFSIENRRVLLVNQAGRALAAPKSYTGVKVGGSLVDLKPVGELVAKRGTRATGSTAYVDPTGIEVLAVYSRVPDVGWGVIVQEPVRVILGPPYRSVVLAMLWMGGFVLLFALLGRYVSLRVTRPLAKLREGAEIIGSGNLDYRIDVRTGDEIEDLADAFNRTAARLETSYHELEQEHSRAVVAARQADTLYHVSQALVSTLRLNDRLDLIAKSLADVCDTDKVALWLVNGNILLPTTSYGLAEDEDKAFDEWEAHLEEASGLTKQVITTHKPVIIADAAADERVSDRMVEQFHVRSILALPLLIEDDVIGYAITYEAGKVREFTDYQVSMAKAVAAQAAVAIQNAQAYERERRIAETLQRSLLPQVPPMIDSFEIADKYESALTEAEIGGDFYDLIRLSPTRIALVMADISGKGLSAAVHTAMIKYMLRAYTLEDIDGPELIRRLNRAVWKYIGEQMFITLFYGVLDTEAKTLTYVNAGHELPLLFGEERHLCTRLETTGTALGIFPEYDFTEKSIEFMLGDSLLLYTDGATDVRRDGEFLGEDGVETIFCGAASGTAHQIVDAVDRGIREYAGGELHDDVALMVIKNTGDTAGRSAESLV